jgi:hypothetical protein
VKRVALTILHYGAEYLSWAMRSVESAVDGFVVAYTDRPSHGHDTDNACPETEEQLRMAADCFVKKPVHWIKGRWPNEGTHREAAFNAARDLGAKTILVLDADEIWDPPTAQYALDQMAARPESFARVRFVHFWRSFHWMCVDGAWPDRLRNVGGSGEWYLPGQTWPVFHMGYAISEAMMRYKWQIHGHKNELRRGWFEGKFANWRPGDCDTHPACGQDYWTPMPTPEPVLTKLMELLGDHPYAKLEIIR